MAKKVMHRKKDYGDHNSPSYRYTAARLAYWLDQGTLAGFPSFQEWVKENA